MPTRHAVDCQVRQVNTGPEHGRISIVGRECEGPMGRKAAAAHGDTKCSPPQFAAVAAQATGYPHTSMNEMQSRASGRNQLQGEYGFMKQHANEFGLAAICRVLQVRRCGYHACLANPPAFVRTTIDACSA